MQEKEWDHFGPLQHAGKLEKLPEYEYWPSREFVHLTKDVQRTVIPPEVQAQLLFLPPPHGETEQSKAFKYEKALRSNVAQAPDLRKDVLAGIQSGIDGVLKAAAAAVATGPLKQTDATEPLKQTDIIEADGLGNVDPIYVSSKERVLEVEVLFLEIDKDRDGAISADELRAYLEIHSGNQEWDINGQDIKALKTLLEKLSTRIDKREFREKALKILSTHAVDVFSPPIRLMENLAPDLHHPAMLVSQTPSQPAVGAVGAVVTNVDDYPFGSWVDDRPDNMDQFTVEQLLDMVDTDDDGFITVKSINDALNKENLKEAKDLKEKYKGAELKNLFKDHSDEKDSDISDSIFQLRTQLDRYEKDLRMIDILDKVKGSMEKTVQKGAFMKAMGVVSVLQQDDESMVEALFKDFDTNNDGLVSADELNKELTKYKDPDKSEIAEDMVEFLEEVLRVLGEELKITNEKFCEVFRKLRQKQGLSAHGQRVQWVRTLGLDVNLERFLKSGDTFDGLRGLKQMDDDETERHISEVCDAFGRVLPKLLRKGLQDLKSTNSSASQGVQKFMNSKFSFENSFFGSYATLEDFHKGLEARNGTPNPNVSEAMEKEHCQRSNKQTRFASPNYNFETWPEQEWEFVYNPKKDFSYPHTSKDGEHWREIVKIDDLLKNPEAKQLKEQAELEETEVIAMRLYTGPMYALVMSEQSVAQKYRAPVIISFFKKSFLAPFDDSDFSSNSQLCHSKMNLLAVQRSTS